MNFLSLHWCLGCRSDITPVMDRPAAIKTLYAVGLYLWRAKDAFVGPLNEFLWLSWNLSQPIRQKINHWLGIWLHLLLVVCPSHSNYVSLKEAMTSRPGLGRDLTGEKTATEARITSQSCLTCSAEVSLSSAQLSYVCNCGGWGWGCICSCGVSCCCCCCCACGCLQLLVLAFAFELAMVLVLVVCFLFVVCCLFVVYSLLMLSFVLLLLLLLLLLWYGVFVVVCCCSWL